MEQLKHIILQEMNETRFSRKHIDAKIKKAITDNPDMVAKMAQGVDLLYDYVNGQYYASKNARMDQVAEMDFDELVLEVFIGVSYCQTPELFTSITAQLAARLKFDDRAAAITTVAEVMAVLCKTDAFDIYKETKQASLMIQSRIPLEQNLVEFIVHSEYLPPMVCEPLELTHNYSSGYLTHNDSLILGSGKHHDGDICLDVLNKMNKVALKLDTEFLSQIEEQPTFELDTRDKYDNWIKFKKQSYVMYDLMVQQGNRFHLTHKVDNRGRIYSCGYHINSQGTSFKKSSIEFADEEVVNGI